MYNLKEIVKKSGAKPYIETNSDRVYKFTNSDFCPDENYIYVSTINPLITALNKIEFHLQNENCKGFFIAKDLIKEEKFLEILHKYSPENVFVAENIYNAGLKIAKAIVESLNSEIILIAGTDETFEIRKKLSYALNIEFFDYESFWEKSLDNILRADENEKYLIVEADVEKKNSILTLARLKENMTVIYSKISIKDISRYEGIEEYRQKWLDFVSNKPKKVFIEKNNNFLNLDKTENLIKVENNLEESVLKSLGVENFNFPEEIENKKVTINKTGSIYSIKKSIQNFISKEGKKVVIMSKIKGLGEFENSIHSEILKEITEKVDFLVLVSMEEKIPYFRANNKKTTLKTIKEADEKGKLEIKQFLKLLNEEAIYLIISKEKALWNII